jgi:hypothetical protein
MTTANDLAIRRALELAGAIAAAFRRVPAQIDKSVLAIAGQRRAGRLRASEG